MADEGARGADFTLEKSGNGAGKEELRSRGGLRHVSTAQRTTSAKERERESANIRIRSWPSVARKMARGRNVEGGVKRK